MAQGGVARWRWWKIFDVIEDLRAGLLAGGEGPAVGRYQFEGAPEAFHGGVVAAVGASKGLSRRIHTLHMHFETSRKAENSRNH